MTSWSELNKRWPEDPDGDMTPILEASIEDAKRRHPSGKTQQGVDMVTEPSAWVQGQTKGVLTYRPDTSDANVLTAADRCDACIQVAVYRVQRPLGLQHSNHDSSPTLDFCLHHWRKNFPAMSTNGWEIVGVNAELAAAMGGEES